jgi:hypothetical protein
MFDFTSLFLIAGIMFGLLAGDAAIYGDTLRVHITVPQSISSAGFTEASAESLFTAEATRFMRGESIIPAPTLRVNEDPTVFTALAKPFNLDPVVAAMQSQFGIEQLLITAAVLAPGDAVRPQSPGTKLDMALVVVGRPHQMPVQTVLEQPDGDVITLIKRGAAWAMEQVSPYRVVLADAIAGAQGDPSGFSQAKETAQRFLARPWNPDRASELALTRNILALLALFANDLKEANAQLEIADITPDLLPQARSVISLNQAFLAVAQRLPDQAARFLAKGRTVSEPLQLPDFGNNLAILEGLVAWSGGDTVTAEAKFRKVVADAPTDETAHHYLAELLTATGHKQGAAAETAAVGASHRFDQKLQGLAVVLFWTDPINGGVEPRN